MSEPEHGGRVPPPPRAGPSKWPEPRRPVDQLTGKPISDRQWSKINPDDYPESRVRALAPEPKVVAGAVVGALTVLVAYVADLAGHQLPPAVHCALTTLLAIGAAYLRSNGDRGK